MRKYEELHTQLRKLKPGDIFISKGETESVYLKKTGEDKHLLKLVESNQEYEVPHGSFPVFKKIIK